MADNLDALLTQRGILDVARAAQWQPFTAHERAGWSYPIYNVRGEPYAERRWKSANGGGPKYLWLWQKPDRAKYYFLPGTLSAIAEKYGNCYLAGGEPDVLAYRAAGIDNAICWLDGEGSPPETLADDLAYMGVTLLLYAPDRDVAGMQSAHKVLKLLEGTGILAVLFQLPGEVGSKYDINDLWIDCQFCPDEFKRRLGSLSGLDPVDMHLYAQQIGPQRQTAVTTVTDTIERWRDQWQQSIMAAMGPPAITENGRARWHCPLPHHEDRHPSFRFTDDQKPGHLWPVCSCGIADDKNAWDTVAAALGHDSWRDFKTIQAAEQGYTQTAPIEQHSLKTAPNASPQLPNEKPAWVDSHAMYDQLREELGGMYQPDIQPIVAPLTVLHRFGGFARFWRRGKLIAVTGISGGGKTTLAKTMMLTLMQNGYDVIWWGPEWDPYEYAEQDLQRKANGLTMDQLDSWRMWQTFQRQGDDVLKTMAAKHGLTRPTEASIKLALSAVDELLAMPGHMYFIPDPELDVDKVLDIAQGIATIKRREGRDVAAFVWDYVQLANMAGARDWTWAERVVGKIKARVNTRLMNVCGIVTSQSRKGDAESVRSGEKQLTVAAGQNLSDSQFNLYLAQTPDYNPGTGDMLNTAWILVGKNSRGRKGKVHVYADWAHLSILDKEVGGGAS